MRTKCRVWLPCLKGWGLHRCSSVRHCVCLTSHCVKCSISCGFVETLTGVVKYLLVRSYGSVEERSVHTGKVAGSIPARTTVRPRHPSVSGVFACQSPDCLILQLDTKGQKTPVRARHLAQDLARKARQDIAKSMFGNVRQLKSGKFQARYTCPDGLTHKAPATFYLKGDAYSWLEAEQKALYLGVRKPPAQREAVARAEAESNALTVRVRLEEWLRHKECEGLKVSTLTKYRERVERRITGDNVPKAVPEFASAPVSAVTAAQARSWWSAVEERWPEFGEMDSKAYQHLRSAFAHLVEDEVIPANPITVKAARRRPKPKLERPPCSTLPNWPRCIGNVWLATRW